MSKEDIRGIFKAAAEEHKPILLDFTAKWCSTCLALDRIIERNIIPRYANKVAIHKVDVNEHEDLIERYDVLLVPTIILCESNGKEIWRKVGFARVEEIWEKLDDTLSTASN